MLKLKKEEKNKQKRKKKEKRINLPRMKKLEKVHLRICLRI
jgi:hypothetical protein